MLLLVTICILLSCNSEKDQKQETEPAQDFTEKVELLANEKLTFIEVSGSPYERGLSHGKLLRKEIHECIKLFKDDIEEATEQNPDTFITKFLKETDFKTATLKWVPEVFDELRGISEGAEIDLETIFMYQLGDEYWCNSKDILAHSCSSIGVNKSPTHPCMAAQNMDIEPFYDGYQTVLKINDQNSDKKMMFLTIPGLLGLTGMNNKSVSINCNTLWQLDCGKTGLPVTFIVRGVVEKDTQEEALKFLKEIKHASGQNYIIGGPQKAFSMECSANKVVEFWPFENSNFTYHTNQSKNNDDFNSRYLEMLKRINRTVQEGFYKCSRFKSFQNRFTENTKDISIDEIKEVLSSRDSLGLENGDVISNDNTFASVIYVHSNEPKLIIAPGKPHEVDYIEIKF